MGIDFTETRELKERVVEINRVAKVVKGGRRFSFTALVVVGDEVDRVGVGYGKAREVPLAITKAVEDAKKNLYTVPKHGSTITHEVLGRFDAARVLLRPASEGTGVIAGGGVRAVLELAGVRNVLAKSLGTTNPINMAKATMAALKDLRRPEDVASIRGKQIHEVLPLSAASLLATRQRLEDAAEALGGTTENGAPADTSSGEPAAEVEAPAEEPTAEAEAPAAPEAEHSPDAAPAKAAAPISAEVTPEPSAMPSGEPESPIEDAVAPESPAPEARDTDEPEPASDTPQPEPAQADARKGLRRFRKKESE